ncbi:MAG: hypothetical protein PVF58_20570 [Candidatus Methanofastidiosia archaeon]|jgi:hypothetical protein
MHFKDISNSTLTTKDTEKSLDIIYVTQSLFTKTIVDFNDVDISVLREKPMQPESEIFYFL